eukprot:CAMPEP_0170544650 /NCGR_PEP_ID=MMETSP0211-20121228/3329_1 /TAXON_ID=311385 /ORGANISM="Pseudokeronopsis sp., Strain OXSARD2" /LENGTH=53 /DNA_ID=CAMNT_0010848345 /DNA_START=1859 /DNA_END=2020 /DNA_ORIENTATION=-
MGPRPSCPEKNDMSRLTRQNTADKSEHQAYMKENHYTADYSPSMDNIGSPVPY